MPVTSDEIAELKTSAKNARLDRDWPGALLDLHDAIDLLLQGISEGTRRGSTFDILAAELADTYGMVGGTERRWGLESFGMERERHLKASIDAYDLGYRYERELRGRDATTYNRLNRLVGRVLLNSEVLEAGAADSVEMISELEDVESVVLEQLDGPRAEDPWAYCDLATIQLLLGSGSALATLSGLDNLRPARFVYTSALETMRPLAEAAGGFRPDLFIAVERLSRGERYAQ